MNQNRWLNLMGALNLSESLQCFEKLVSSYAENHRHYHTGHHIDAMLKHFDKVAELAEHPHEVELAIWFHDAIYKPFSSKNEENSALWAKKFLVDSGYCPAGVNRVYQLIMATCHSYTPVSIDEKLIIDIDLTILGASTSVFEAYEKQVRKEYRLVPIMIYKKKRRELLREFLSQKRLYHTDYFHSHFDAQARSNIKRSIQAF
ncbi:hypothetical protein BTJ40_11525 [Microbulbifer sp. A4B17]|uniref:HD domain-containing protein n=1 Tax=Microbulbifer sp. A4B17 TaxID=359370 RepID=UPI000D52A81E|nr:hypothetical protein [Microbulbifer sp. A4B17]AWF81396.1 hypothetical protein BTJ40_11525 [Microbulbifer sp. A4B17]